MAGGPGPSTSPHRRARQQSSARFAGGDAGVPVPSGGRKVLECRPLECTSMREIYHVVQEFLPEKDQIRPSKSFEMNGTIIAKVPFYHLRRTEPMRKAARPDVVYSKPTMCLHCHLIVEMT